MEIKLGKVQADIIENIFDYKKLTSKEINKYINSIGYFVSVQIPNQIWRKIFDEETTYLFKNNCLYIVKRV